MEPIFQVGDYVRVREPHGSILPKGKIYRVFAHTQEQETQKWCINFSEADHTKGVGWFEHRFFRVDFAKTRAGQIFLQATQTPAGGSDPSGAGEA
jgi:hypothetical protein